jgi:hypothetical protein
VEGRLVGEDGDTIVDCVDVAFVRAVLEAYVGFARVLLT